VKLCVPEAESAALLEYLGERDRSISSELTVVETARAGARVAGADGLARAEQACSRLDLLPISRSILDRATALTPPELRSLDAIHLATALEPRTPPVVVAYDARLLSAAREQGLTTASPGR
jgi:predicted nucleic acid-binding protein